MLGGRAGTFEAVRVFVAGATGVLGSGAVSLLVEAGHEVTGVARTQDKAEQLRAAGATPVVVDLFDAGAVTSAVAGHEVVCNLTTHIPPVSKAASPRAMAENDRIRTEVSQHLVDAAVKGGARRYVQESIVFMYADHGNQWIFEDSLIDAPPYMRSALHAEGQARRFTDAGAGGAQGVVLRFGMFYGPRSSHSRAIVAAARWRLRALPGHKHGYFSMLHTDDAASAVVASLAVPGGTYNVVEDEPLTRAQQTEALAAAVGVHRLWAAPRFVYAMGGSAVRALGRSQRVSNRRFKHEARWAPRYPSVREGWPATVEALLRSC